MFRSLRLLPLTLIPLLIYNAVAFAMAGNQAGDWFSKTQFSLPLPLGGIWQVTFGDILLFLTLIVLFVELLKSTSSGTAVMIDHMLATLVFIVCLVEFMVVYRAGTSVFFAITVAALIDVVAGFSISMRIARRSVGFGG
jgi:hypothetical protein